VWVVQGLGRIPHTVAVGEARVRPAAPDTGRLARSECYAEPEGSGW
jgi:hypothetical protein